MLGGLWVRGIGAIDVGMLYSPTAARKRGARMQINMDQSDVIPAQVA